MYLSGFPGILKSAPSLVPCQLWTQPFEDMTFFIWEHSKISVSFKWEQSKISLRLIVSLSLLHHQTLADIFLTGSLVKAFTTWILIRITHLYIYIYIYTCNYLRSRTLFLIILLKSSWEASNSCTQFLLSSWGVRVNG